MMVDVNKQQMIDNQSYVKHILINVAGEDNLVDVETDYSYNRPQPVRQQHKHSALLLSSAQRKN